MRTFLSEVEPAKRGRKANDVKNGTKTLRFKADGKATIEEVDDVTTKVIERINALLETYMGINDSDLGKHKSYSKYYSNIIYQIISLVIV